MKNTKAIFLIILGSFILATGFAFANDALDQARNPNLFNDKRGGSVGVNVRAELSAPIVSQPLAVNQEAPAEKPSPLKKAKEFVGNNFNQIMGAAVIGFLGFLVIGTGGAGLAVGLGAFAFFMLLKNL